MVQTAQKQQKNEPPVIQLLPAPKLEVVVKDHISQREESSSSSGDCEGVGMSEETREILRGIYGS